MSVIINQFQGLGDIIFCMKIAEYLLSIGHEKIIWPVNPIYLDIQKHFPKIQFVNKETFNIDYNRRDFYDLNLLGESFTVIPLRFSDSICKVPYYDCMRSKYMLSGLDMSTWRDIDFVIDDKKSNELFERFGSGVLVNRYFTTGSNMQIDIKANGIEMQTIKGYTLFDWSKVIMNATEIHTVGTSINYLIELLKPKCPIHLYTRKPQEKDFKNYNYILSKDLDYRFHL